MAEHVLTELEPVTLNDQTEVKLPFNGLATPEGDPQQSPIFTPNRTARSSDDPVSEDLDENVCLDVNEYNRLLRLAEDLPCRLFVNQILLDYDNSPERLEYLRSMLFSSIRDSSDYGIERGCELKRRVKTRNGDPLAVKLSSDIHTLLLVLQGDVTACLKEIVTFPKNSRKQSVSQTPLKSQTNVHGKCLCCVEVAQIKDTLSALQADVLQLKQKDIANACSKVQQIEAMQETLTCAQQDISSLRISLSDIKTEFDDKVSYGEIRKLNEHLRTVDRAILTVQDKLISFFSITPIETSEDTTDSGKEPREPTNDSYVDDVISHDVPEEGAHHESVEPETKESTYPTLSLDKPESFYPTFCFNKHKSTGLDKPEPPIVTNGHSSKQVYHRGRNGTRYIGKNVNFDTSVRETHAKKAYKEKRVYFNKKFEQSSENCQYDDDEDTFERHVKKRAKNYFIGGFRSSITEAKIEHYINEKGLQVKYVSISVSKRQNVIVRVGIEDNGNADDILEDFFFPRGIVCRPWRPVIRNQKWNEDRYTGNNNEPLEQLESGDINDFVHNRYQPLDIE